MDIPIQRNRTEVQYRCSAAHHVERDPSIAEAWPEHPVTQEIVNSRERHHQAADEQVRDR